MKNTANTRFPPWLVNFRRQIEARNSLLDMILEPGLLQIPGMPEVLPALIDYVKAIGDLKKLHERKALTGDFYEIRVKDEIVAVNRVPDIMAKHGLNVDDRIELFNAVIQKLLNKE